MNQRFEFPKILLTPCNFNNMALLDNLSDAVCERRIKEEFRHHMQATFAAHHHDYPRDSKEIYIVPFSKVREAYELGYTPAPFAMLWLPSLAGNLSEVRDIVPGELKENPIVAWSDYSIFRSNNILRLDPGFGEALFILTTNQIVYPLDWQFLAEYE